MLNASPPATDLAELAGLTDVVVVNESEAAQWHWPVPHLVITRGAHGASYVGAHTEFGVAAPAVEPVDTSGAGDVFAGCWPPTGAVTSTAPCVAPARPEPWRHSFPGPVTAHR
ncbi:pfkB carbohydrate kinase family protein [Mycobacterium xenopi 4042]|uniref:PfkB carbohydrate kinase family protein n=1 Tax=Mycobacterium xenopi 4042 TaxID=1299334 RepID=X8AQ27_MYCXE|nr:pfkB carbohydrate kinase family protein [Mycobacterium xenopi 3993]EUA33231.1 pfkB carbohydrate kinase family protein [Mycobacterium xenopi 4042]